jgi:hypothetical protein
VATANREPSETGRLVAALKLPSLQRSNGSAYRRRLLGATSAQGHKRPATAGILLRRSKGKGSVMTRIHWVTRGGTRVEKGGAVLPVYSPRGTGDCDIPAEPRSRVRAQTRGSRPAGSPPRFAGLP